MPGTLAAAAALVVAVAGCGAAADGCAPGGDAAAPSFELTLRPIRDGEDVAAIAVTEVVRGGLATDADVLSLAAPVVYAGVTGIADRVLDLEVRDCRGPVVLSRADDPAAPGGFPYFRHWRAERAVAFPVTVTYRSAVRPLSELGGPPFGIRATAGGVSGAGAGFLLLPENAAATTSRVSWNLAGLAEGSRAVTSFGAGDFVLEGPPAALRQGWYMAGPFGRYPETGDANGFSAAWLGSLPFDARREMAWAAEAYTFLGGYFRYLDPPPRYRVFMRTVPGQPRGAGTALPNSFMLSSHPAGEGDGDRAARDRAARDRAARDRAARDRAARDGAPRATFLHEMIHQWVGGVEGPNGVTSWFSEGLTTYYTTVLPLAAGFETPEALADAINQLARSYYTNPALTWPADKIAAVGFADNRIRHLPYQRGALYFADLDAKIRGRSGGARNLHAFMRELFERRQDAAFRFDHDAWIAMVSEAAGPAAAEAFRGSVLGGSVLAPASDAFGPCFERRPASYRTDEGGTVDGFRWERVAGVPGETCAAFVLEGSVAAP